MTFSADAADEAPMGIGATRKSLVPKYCTVFIVEPTVVVTQLAKQICGGQDLYTRLFHRTPVTTSEPRLRPYHRIPWPTQPSRRSTHLPSPLHEIICNQHD